MGLRSDAIRHHRPFHVRVILGSAWGGDERTPLNVRGACEIEGEALGEHMLFGAEAAGGEDGGGQRAWASRSGFAPGNSRVR